MSEIRMRSLSSMIEPAEPTQAATPESPVASSTSPVQPALNLRPIELSTEAAPDLFAIPPDEQSQIPTSADPDQEALAELTQALTPQEGDMTMNGTTLSDQGENATSISKGVFATVIDDDARRQREAEEIRQLLESYSLDHSVREDGSIIMEDGEADEESKRPVILIPKEHFLID